MRVASSPNSWSMETFHWKPKLSWSAPSFPPRLTYQCWTRILNKSLKCLKKDHILLDLFFFFFFYKELWARSGITKAGTQRLGIVVVITPVLRYTEQQRVKWLDQLLRVLISQPAHCTYSTWLFGYNVKETLTIYGITSKQAFKFAADQDLSFHNAFNNTSGWIKERKKKEVSSASIGV